MEQADTRTKLLIGEEGAAVLKARTVCVLGIGGVGSFCVEAPARSGIGRLILVDGDVVAPSNLNRQLMAVQETIGKAKTEAMAERIRQYRSDIEIRCVNPVSYTHLLCQHHAGEDRNDRSADDRDLFAQPPARQSDPTTTGNSR